MLNRWMPVSRDLGPGWELDPDARRILGEYIEPGPRDATRTVERLLAILDRNEVVRALDRIKRRRVIRLVE
jgi:hypothetical protein